MNVTADKPETKRVLLGQEENALVNLVAYNAVVFLILKFLLVIYQLSGPDLTAYYADIFHRLTLPADPGNLATRPWTILSYMFVHENFIHLLANILWLWLFGYIFQEIVGNRRLIPLYLYGGITGAVFYLLASLVFPHADSAVFLGANAAVMAVATGVTMASPGYRIFPLIKGGLPLWTLTVAYVIIDIVSVSSGNLPVYISHISGAALGFVFILQWQKGKDWSNGLNSLFDWVKNLFNPDKKAGRTPVKEEFFYKVNDSGPYKKTLNVTQHRIDIILDKINQEGYDLLTDEEKDVLKRAANDGVL